MDPQRCQYASKPCDNTRSLKDNGELHRLCIYHRTRANDAQRRWHSRQRAAPTVTQEDKDKPQVAAVSVRTKRRRRTKEDENHRPRRRRHIAKTTAKTKLAIEAPVSPLSVDSAACTTVFDSVQAPLFAPFYDHDRLSDEDFALLDELMQDLDDVHAPMLDSFVAGDMYNGAFLTPCSPEVIPQFI